MSAARSPPKIRRMRRALVVAYVVLLAASQAWLALRPERAPEPGHAVELPVCDDDGPRDAGRMRVALHRGGPEPADGGPLPVLLLHGSPGRGAHMTRLGAALAEEGRPWVAPDLPGFGDSEPWVPSYSIRAHAHAALELLDALGLERAHVVGWSMGGGVALHLAELAPERVASVALVASIGVQRAEGSGSYAFEHLKYAFLYGLVVVAPELVPHFGLLGPRAPRHAFVRNFMDTDQRPLEDLLRGLERPALIVQGRQDFLVPAWCAERSHELAPESELVMFDGTHFLVWDGRGGGLTETLAALSPFLARADEPGSEPRRGRRDTSSRVDAAGSPPGWPLEPFELPRRTAWGWSFAALALLAALAPIEAVALGGTALARLQVDAGVAALACLFGAAVRAAVRGRRVGRGGRGWRLVLAPVGTALALVPAAALAGPLSAALAPRLGVFGADLACLALLVGGARGLRALRRRRRARVR